LSLVLGRYSLAAQFFLAVTLTWALFFPIRYVMFKPRPKKVKYHNLVERLDASSFPSLHAARSVMLAMILSQIFVQLEVRALLWLFAFGVIWSRYHLKKHYIEDLAVGAVIGLVLGYLLVTFV
jgi:membrane-associated phospholipid phosphatase